MRILATDLDTNMLARARAGRTPAAKASDIPEAEIRELIGEGTLTRGHAKALLAVPAASILVSMFRYARALADDGGATAATAPG